MTFTESSTVERMILDAATKLSGGRGAARVPEMIGEAEAVSVKVSVKGAQKTAQKIVESMLGNPETTIAEIALAIFLSGRTIRNQIARLRERGRVRRVGPDKGGHWEVLE